ncbi:MAG: ParA family protein [Prevotella sp.]|jgi:chromosome partitioning protein|nr:ParA family protein [Prevotella sp.]
MVQIITVLNHKGGVGKTTSSVNIGAGLSIRGKKVLLIDLDPQANLTLHFSLPINKTPNVYEALRGESPLPVTKVKENLDVVTSSLDLTAAESELSGVAGREFILKELVSKIKSEYDFIIIDCPPSLGLLTLNALAVSDYMIIPIEMGDFALAGMNKLFEIVQLVQKRLNTGLTQYRILLTKVDTRKTLHKEIKETICENFNGKTFDTIIPTNVALEEAQMQGEDIYSYNPESTGAAEYLKVCDEILEIFK